MFFPIHWLLSSLKRRMKMNLKEEKLSALTRQKARLIEAKKNFGENSNDYRTIEAVIQQHDKEIKKLLDD